MTQTRFSRRIARRALPTLALCCSPRRPAPTSPCSPSAATTTRRHPAHGRSFRAALGSPTTATTPARSPAAGARSTGMAAARPPPRRTRYAVHRLSNNRGGSLHDAGHWLPPDAAQGPSSRASIRPTPPPSTSSVRCECSRRWAATSPMPRSSSPAPTGHAGDRQRLRRGVHRRRPARRPPAGSSSTSSTTPIAAVSRPRRHRGERQPVFLGRSSIRASGSPACASPPAPSRGAERQPRRRRRDRCDGRLHLRRAGDRPRAGQRRPDRTGPGRRPGAAPPQGTVGLPVTVGIAGASRYTRGRAGRARPSSVPARLALRRTAPAHVEALAVRTPLTTRPGRRPARSRS